VQTTAPVIMVYVNYPCVNASLVGPATIVPSNNARELFVISILSLWTNIVWSARLMACATPTVHVHVTMGGLVLTAQ
jgi:hypothetical protein